MSKIHLLTCQTAIDYIALASHLNILCPDANVRTKIAAIVKYIDDAVNNDLDIESHSSLTCTGIGLGLSKFRRCFHGLPLVPEFQGITIVSPAHAADIRHRLWWTAGGNGPSSRPSADRRCGGRHHGSRIHFPEPRFQCGGYGRTRPCGYNRTAADRCRHR
jgi:hypothetical protein